MDIAAIQIAFLDGLKKKLSGKLLASEMASTLGITKSEAYNKMKSRSLLTTTQIHALCMRYQINFSISGRQDMATTEVRFTPFHVGNIRVSDYMDTLSKFIDSIAQAKDKKLTCATDDIPIFHLFKYPELTAFKLHFWNARVERNAHARFDFAKADQKALQTASHIHDIYQTIPCVEIWTKSSLLNTLEQIKYAYDTQLLKDKGLGKTICAQLRAALADIELYAVNRSKSLQSPVLFEWYFYEIIGCITYLAEMDGEKSAFLRFNTFNNLHADDGPLCTEVKYWLDTMINDSTGFSGQGSVHRNRYLQEAFESCDALTAMF